jgi:hypothetical protein
MDYSYTVSKYDPISLVEKLCTITAPTIRNAVAQFCKQCLDDRKFSCCYYDGSTPETEMAIILDPKIPTSENPDYIIKRAEE